MLIDKILFSKEEIEKAVDRVSKKINSFYKNQTDEITVICVLKGAVIFYADLVRGLNLTVNFDFIQLSSYKNSTSSDEKVETVQSFLHDVAGKHILIVEDILDTGKTLDFFTSHLKIFSPASIKTAVLFDKPSRRIIDFKADFVGFEIDDLFIVGYGLDYAGKYRNLPYVASLK